MTQRLTTMEVSVSLAPLREVVASLAEAAGGAPPTGNERRRVVRSLRAAGAAAVPALVRALGSPSESEVEWARWLLARLALGSARGRIVEHLARLLEDPRPGDEVKARAVGLLAELQAPMPERVVLHDPDRLFARSVTELLGSLASDEDVSVAAGLIAGVVPEEELPAFAAQVVRHGGQMALPLLDALVEAGPRSEAARAAVESMRDLLLGDDDDDGTACDRRTLPRRRGREGAAEARAEGLRLVEGGEHARARALLERAIEDHPDDGEALSHLGVCLLALGEPEGALRHLERAAELAPDEPLHHWNVAAAAKGADKLCLSYLALERYLELPDEFEGWRGRRMQARRFMSCYEKLIRAMHPDAPFQAIVRGEQLFHQAFLAFTDGRFEQASAGFRGVLELLPAHYPSWGNLGAAQLALGRNEEARRCLARALELRPDYRLARENLSLLDEHP